MQKFLLHTCCGPCSIAIIDELRRGELLFAPTVFFYNPNIHPLEEYERRREAVMQICQEMNIPFVEGEYETEKWFELTKDYKDEPEGGQRCTVCFKLRLERTAQYARENGFDWFGTTLTSGRNKKAEIINPLGKEIGERYGVKFYEEDWKKKGRQEKARKMVEGRGIYRQDYCGCVYSFLLFLLSFCF